MSAFLPGSPRGEGPDRNLPSLRQRPFSPAERKARWEVRAAQWRARELAEGCFGRVGAMGMIGIRPDGPLRGLLRMEVPFTDLDGHRASEARFMAAVEADPLLASVRLLYVVGPDSV
jgi:hypothetical protein